MRIIGIDPGKSGGVSWLDLDLEPRSRVDAAAVKMPDTEPGVSELLRRLRDTAAGDVYAYLELVHAMPALREERDDQAAFKLMMEITGNKENRRVLMLLRGASVGVTMKVMQGSVGTFTFGQGYGFLRGCLRTAEIPFESVRPQDWQTVCGCRTRGDKNISKRRAIELFPRLTKITHATADALLIAECGRRMGVANRRPE